MPAVLARDAAPDGAPGGAAELDARLARVEMELARLSARVENLERAPHAALSDSAPALPPSTAQPSIAAAFGDAPARAVAHFGQALIALGGAYLLRALTDDGVVSAAIGAGLGVAYALAWLLVSIAAARRGNRIGATFAGALTPIIAVPLVLEAAFRFRIWSGETALLGQSVICAGGLLAAAVSRVQATAWFIAAGSAAVAAIVMVQARTYVASELFFVALGIATLWLGYVRGWVLLRWPAALIADLVALALVSRARVPEAGESPAAVLAVVVALFASYLASIGVRTVLLNRAVLPFELVQTSALVPLTLGAAAVLVPPAGSTLLNPGAMLIPAGVLSYALAFVFVERRRSGPINTHFYGTLGVVLTAAGGVFLFDGAALAVLWMTISVLLAASAWYTRPAFAVHAWIFALCAAFASGFIGYAIPALASMSPNVAMPAAIHWFGSLVLIGCTVALAYGPAWPLQQVVVLLAAVTAFVSAAGLVTGTALSLLHGPVPSAPAAAIRTIAIAAMIAAAAGLARLDGLRSLAWLVYPALAILGAKLLLDDVRHLPPLWLFVVLAAYGASAILAARAGRRMAA